MKRRILLFSAIAAAFSFALSSYHDGIIAHPGGGATDFTQGGLTCANGAGCHPAAYDGLALNIQMQDATGHPVDRFFPGHTYKILLQGQYTGTAVTNLKKFGFQANMYQWDTTKTFATASPLDPATITSVVPSTVTHGSANGGTLYEQTNTLTNPISGSTNLNTYEVDFTWAVPNDTTAPDSIAIFSTMCAVQGTGVLDSDVCIQNAPHATFYNAITAAVPNIFNEVSFKSYPNPVSNALHIQMDHMKTGSYAINVYDMMGRNVFSQPIMVNSSSYKTEINTSNWASGIYHVQISQGDATHTISVVK